MRYAATSSLKNGPYTDVCLLEIIIPVAFRLNTYYTHMLRTWLVDKALSKNKRQTYVMFILKPFLSPSPNKTTDI